MPIPAWICGVLAASLILPLLRVMAGPSIYDRVLGVNAVASKTFLLILLVGLLYERLDMFVDIALAYALLNFVGSVAVAHYLERKTD